MEQSENVMRLAKPKRKGLMGLVFSRLMIVVLLLAVQVLLYLSVFDWFRQYLPHYAVLQSVFIFLMTIYLFNNKMDSTAKLTWLAVIAILPADPLKCKKDGAGHQVVF